MRARMQILFVFALFTLACAKTERFRLDSHYSLDFGRKNSEVFGTLELEDNSGTWAGIGFSTNDSEGHGSMTNTVVFVIGTPEGVKLYDPNDDDPHAAPSPRADQSSLVSSEVLNEVGKSVYTFSLKISEIPYGAETLIWAYGGGSSFSQHVARGDYGAIPICDFFARAQTTLSDGYTLNWSLAEDGSMDGVLTQSTGSTEHYWIGIGISGSSAKHGQEIFIIQNGSGAALYEERNSDRNASLEMLVDQNALLYTKLELSASVSLLTYQMNASAFFEEEEILSVRAYSADGTFGERRELRRLVV